MAGPSIAQSLMLMDRLRSSGKNQLLADEQLRGAQNQNALTAIQMQQYPQERAYTEKRRGWEEEDRRRTLAQGEEERAKKWVTDTIDYVTPDNYTEYAKAAVAKGVPSAFFPEPGWMAQPGNFEKWHPKYRAHMFKVAEQTGTHTNKMTEIGAQNAGRVAAAEVAARKTGAPTKGVDENGNPVFFRIRADGSPEIVQGVKPELKKGMKIYDPATGNLLVDTGGSSGADMTKKTVGDIEEKIISGKEQIARMQSIAAEFKPEYQEIGTRLSASWTGLKATLGKDVSPQEAQQLTEFKKYQRKAIENINLYIKEITGAQMSEREADRLRLAQPDPGEKWYQGDDPITFKSKMDDVLKTARAAVARYEYYRSKGFSNAEIKKIVSSDAAISLDSIASKME